MKDIYNSLDISRQCFYQCHDRFLKHQDLKMQLIPLISDVRKDHPQMSVRKIYQILSPDGIGRDMFEEIAYEYGYKLPRKRNFQKTTNSFGVRAFPNLTSALELNDVNQVWVTDITYYYLGDKFHYLTIIMDRYSRVIVGASVSSDLRTINTTLPALRQALRKRAIGKNSDLIIHSDRGGQYYSKEFLKLTEAYGIRNSMCKEVYANSNAERVIGTLKNQYIYPYGPSNPKELVRDTNKAIRMYNCYRPHDSLFKFTPIEFESYIKGLNIKKRPIMNVYQEDEALRKSKSTKKRKK